VRRLPARRRPVVWHCRALLLAEPWTGSADDPPNDAEAHSSRPPSAGKRPARRRRDAKLRTRDKTLLVVDDEPAVRLICRVNLTASGYRVLEAEDGIAAFEVAKAEQPDLILLDVMMPRSDGFMVAAALAADPATRAVPIVFLSARTASADLLRAHELGAVGYLTKPFDPLQLTRSVTTVLERLERGEVEALRDEFRARISRA